MTDAPPIIIDEDAAIDSAFFGSHAGRTCYARAHRSGWVLVVRQAVAQREPPVMLRVWSRLHGCRMTMRAAWYCGSVAPIRADAARQGGATFRNAPLAPLLGARPIGRDLIGAFAAWAAWLGQVIKPDSHVKASPRGDRFQHSTPEQAFISRSRVCCVRDSDRMY
jgi:hypothetical protein